MPVSMPQTLRGRLMAGASLVASLALIAFAERDLQRRSRADVRGPKLVWRLASLNAVGALVYLAVGRRRPRSP